MEDKELILYTGEEGMKTEEKMNLNHPDFLRPERLEEETPYQYKVRKIMNKLYIKQKKKGSFMWISKDTKQPVFAKEDTEMKGKPIGYTVSKGFTYNKEQVKKALEKYKKEKHEQQAKKD